MAPAQCPECARFLSNDFVVALATAPAPCPKCEVELTAERFRGHAGLDEVLADEPVLDADEPTLGTDEVIDLTAPQPLAGWDEPDEPVSYLDGRGPQPAGIAGLPPDVAAGVAALGALLGAVFSGHRRGTGALVGAVASLAAAAAGLTAWRRQVDG